MARRRRLWPFSDFWQDNPEFSVFLVAVVGLAGWAVFSHVHNPSGDGGSAETVAGEQANPTAVVTTTRLVKRNGKLVKQTVKSFATVTNGVTSRATTTAFSTLGVTTSATATTTTTQTIGVPGPTSTETVTVPGPTETVTVPGPTETVTATVTETPPAPPGN